MRRNDIVHTDREGMIATSFLILYLLFSYVFVYWTRTMSNATLSRENFIVNIVMYIIPCVIVVMMVFMRDSTLTSLGINKRGSTWLLGLLILSLIFYTQNIFVKILIVVISEEIIFRGYAGDRLKATFGSSGSVIVAGFILGSLYSLIPVVNRGIGILDFTLYIGLGIITQLILQRMFHYFGNIYLSIILHSGILFIAL